MFVRNISIQDCIYYTEKIEKGEFLLIYPNVSHRSVYFAENTKKYSFTFSKDFNEKAICYFIGVAACIDGGSVCGKC